MEFVGHIPVFLIRARGQRAWRARLIRDDKRRKLETLRRNIGRSYELLPRRDWQR